jgi:hypothetical protein
LQTPRSRLLPGMAETRADKNREGAVAREVNMQKPEE